jgi:uncharacterized membrane protein YcaP (DUF421 family)
VLIGVALHTLAIFTFLVIGLRTIGRRALAQLGVVDLVVILLLGSAVETAMVAGHTQLSAGFVSAATLLIVNRVLTAILARSRRFRHIVNGLPLLVVHNGELLGGHLRRAGLTPDALAEALRQRGEPDYRDLRQAILEPDGTLHVIPSSSKR